MTRAIFHLLSHKIGVKIPILVKIGALVLTYALLSSLLAQTKVGGSHLNIISSKSCPRGRHQELPTLMGAN